MSKISKALNKLRAKCTEAGTSPHGNGIADIIDCIAEHFNVDGEDGQDGADGASVTAIAFTKTEGEITGGTATLSDGSTIDITVTEG